MNEHLYVGSESGKLIKFDIKAHTHQLIYQHPQSRVRNHIMGLAFWRNRLYFGGRTVLGFAEIEKNNFVIRKIIDFYTPKWDRLKTKLRKFWSQIGADVQAMKYAQPIFHRMNIYGSSIYVTATEYNEVWELDEELNLRRRIVIQPHLLDYNHINNVFFDGDSFYVCLNRYQTINGYGGYAKFDRDWNEIERRRMGWESHALCIIEGKVINLSASAGGIKNISHPHRAGLMVNGELVFEHNPDKYFCKDISMDDEHIYIVGGESKKREERGMAAGVVFILNRKYELLKECVLPGTEDSADAVCPIWIIVTGKKLARSTCVKSTVVLKINGSWIVCHKILRCLNK